MYKTTSALLPMVRIQKRLFIVIPPNAAASPRKFDCWQDDKKSINIFLAKMKFFPPSHAPHFGWRVSECEYVCMCVWGGGSRVLQNKYRITNEPSQTTLEPRRLQNQQLFPNEMPFSFCEPRAENSMRVHASPKFKRLHSIYLAVLCFLDRASLW